MGANTLSDEVPAEIIKLCASAVSGASSTVELNVIGLFCVTIYRQDPLGH
jgi:hypothetical protein